MGDQFVVWHRDAYYRRRAVRRHEEDRAVSGDRHHEHLPAGVTKRGRIVLINKHSDRFVKLIYFIIFK